MITSSMPLTSARARQILALMWAIYPRPTYAAEMGTKLGVPAANLKDVIRALTADGFLEPSEAPGDGPRHWATKEPKRCNWLRLSDEGYDTISENLPTVRQLSWEYEHRWYEA